MEPAERIEAALEAVLHTTVGADCPPGLQAALRWAVFPGGGRVRARLCLAVAGACGDDAPALAAGAAVAVELLHCASLAHDDLPCFDDAATRRGRDALHARFGEPRALLVGDGLIVLAFEQLARAGRRHPERLPALLAALGRGAGAACGLVAGQAWESEAELELERYHRTKSAALVEAATAGGAIAAGADGAAWREPGRLLGLAYQVADDIADAAGDPARLGKPAGQDAAHGRPSAVAAYGLAGALERLDGLQADAAAALPACSGRDRLVDLFDGLGRRLCPPALRERLAAAATS